MLVIYLRGPKAGILPESVDIDLMMHVYNPPLLVALNVLEQSRDTHKTPHDYGKYQRMKASEQTNDGASTLVPGETRVVQVDEVIASVSTLGCKDIDYV
ncbi:hypothetical protein EVAR_80613_1 [Eumeta japonica]|uniref:Uncharacterized protein n=1 Tax=Eumeta variegata TaxID=151549 RepID=A0A4C1TMV8_EUMVA|nr:hypothetical protein EVAR_80613_1 [Eumeta japonica]